MNWSAVFEPMEHERRFVRFTAPTQQLRLALWVFVVTMAFVALVGVNSYAAYGRLMDNVLRAAPEVFRSEIALQTTEFATVTAALLLAYALTLVVTCGAYVNRLTGPTVALERHVQALRRGEYRTRVRLRGGGETHARLARELNELAEQLDMAERLQAQAGGR